MSETSPIYSIPPPALLSTDQLAALADALAEERQGCAAEPANPLGFWPTAVAALMNHVAALTMRADSADWTAEALAIESRVLRAAVEAATARAEKAEARVKEQQAELAEQEVDKMQLIRELSLAVGSAPIAAR